MVFGIGIASAGGGGAGATCGGLGARARRRSLPGAGGAGRGGAKGEGSRAESVTLPPEATTAAGGPGTAAGTPGGRGSATGTAGGAGATGAGAAGGSSAAGTAPVSEAEPGVGTAGPPAATAAGSGTGASRTAEVPAASWSAVLCDAPTTSLAGDGGSTTSSMPGDEVLRQRASPMPVAKPSAAQATIIPIESGRRRAAPGSRTCNSCSRGDCGRSPSTFFKASRIVLTCPRSGSDGCSPPPRRRGRS